MRIIFVRHGEPDYARDCLTDVGKAQAAAAAERLAGEGISEIYASPCGRARETAGYTARRLGLPEDGHPWTLGDWMIDREDFNFLGGDWREHPWFRTNAARDYVDLIEPRFDAFLAGHGYAREGSRYRCRGGSDKTVALFSHGGSGAVALARALSLPFPYVASVMPYDFTSVIILNFPVCEGACVHPRLELFNDCAHIHDRTGPKLQQASE